MSSSEEHFNNLSLALVVRAASPVGRGRCHVPGGRESELAITLSRRERAALKPSAAAVSVFGSRWVPKHPPDGADALSGRFRTRWTLIADRRERAVLWGEGYLVELRSHNSLKERVMVERRPD